jgi:hypothetical protein
VPAILVGALGSLVCGTEVDPSSGLPVPSNLVEPTGTPLTGYPVPGSYWVQKVHTWQAQCFTAASATAFASWGDNLAGEAKLKVGSPIRVELVLTNLDDYSGLGGLKGYTVIKLEPGELDRESAYGHEATVDPISGAWVSTPIIFQQAEWLVHDAGITFSVQNLDTEDYVVPPLTPPTAEINATGKVVYGYNLRVSTAGNYQIQFTTSPAVTLTDVDAGELIDVNNVSIDINVGPGGSGGGGGGPRR